MKVFATLVSIVNLVLVAMVLVSHISHPQVIAIVSLALFGSNAYISGHVAGFWNRQKK
jgi:hypothetical protein